MSINHTDETEITASIAHQLEQPMPALVTDNDGHQDTSILNPADSLHGTALKHKLSIGEWLLYFYADLDFESLSSSEDVSSSKKHKGPVEIIENTDQIIPLQQSPQNTVVLYPKSIPNTVITTSTIPQFSSIHGSDGIQFQNLSTLVESVPLQPIPPAITNEPSSNETHLESPVIPEFGNQTNGKGLLMSEAFYFYSCTYPHLAA